MVETYIGYLIFAGIVAFIGYKVVWPKVKKYIDKGEG